MASCRLEFCSMISLQNDHFLAKMESTVAIQPSRERGLEPAYICPYKNVQSTLVQIGKTLVQTFCSGTKFCSGLLNNGRSRLGQIGFTVAAKTSGAKSDRRCSPRVRAIKRRVCSGDIRQQQRCRRARQPAPRADQWTTTSSTAGFRPMRRRR